ncbi:MAG: hypothetical protein RIT81_08115 [Deltaproteobacteria bacterium]
MRIRSFVVLLAATVGCAGGAGDEIVPPPRDSGFVRDAGVERDAGPGRDGGFRDGGPRDGGPARDGGPGRDGGFVCTPPLIECNSSCVDPFADAMHCGACDTPCTAPDTCLVGVCSGPPLAITASIAPQLIGSGCDGAETQADTVAIDPANNLYVAMLCGNGDARVARSTNGGVSYTPAVPIGFSESKQVTIVADGPGVLHAFAQTIANSLLYARSFDFGATWSAPRIIDGGPINSGFNSLRVNAVARRGYVAASVMVFGNAMLRVYRNEASGSGAFLRTEIGFGSWGGNLALDPTNDDVLLLVESIEEARVYRSTDRGASFAPIFTSGPLATAPEYAWAPPYAIAACSIYMFGMKEQPPCFFRLDTTTMQSAPITVPTGFLGVYSLGYGSVALGSDGTAYVALDEGADPFGPKTGMAIGRIAPGATAISDVRIMTRDYVTDFDASTIDMRIVPGTSAAVVTFTTDAGVWAAVEVF